jgi:peptide/bleomycin uptake transporter
MLVAFIPILWELSENVKYIPIIGEIDRGLMWACLLMAIIGTGLLSLVGRKLPGIEFDIQKEEAAYRKQLVKAEDNLNEIDHQKFDSLFENVRKIHYFSYLHYFYFSISKFSFLQAMVIFPYLIMGPTIISAGITLGVVSQTVRAFGKVSESMQYIIRGWLEIVELISVYKRLRGFEKKFLENREVANV